MPALYPLQHFDSPGVAYHTVTADSDTVWLGHSGSETDAAGPWEFASFSTTVPAGSSVGPSGTKRGRRTNMLSPSITTPAMPA